MCVLGLAAAARRGDGGVGGGVGFSHGDGEGVGNGPKGIDASSFATIIKMLGRHSKHEEAKKYLNMMLSELWASIVGPPVHLFNTMVSTFGKARLLEDALGCLEHVKDFAFLQARWCSAP